MHLSVIMPNLLTWDGDRPVTGGLERYLWQLLRLLRRLGYEVDVHQNGDSDWVREVEGFRIQGHGVAAVSLDAAVQAMNHATGRALYATPFYRGTYYKPGSVVIAHGVWWDSPEVDRASLEASIGVVYDVLAAAEAVVACDYNLLNVARATVPWQTRKIRVIPNFADCRLFHPAGDDPAGDGPADDESPPGSADDQRPADRPLVILYPRRISPYRGYELFLQAAAELRRRLPDLPFRLRFAVDRNYPEDQAKLTEAIAAAGLASLTEVGTYGFDEMPQVYREADLVVIPSLYSEGTSFSCVEALASGCAVVATNVGGLTNLILDGYNGRLIDPSLPALSAALVQLAADPPLRRRLAAQARQTAFAVDLPRWEEAWAEVIRQVYGEPA